jgi:GH35 family endo-1,4-beta-xylanase
MWWRPDIARRDLNRVQDLGFGWVKQSFAWRDIETLEKDKYDWWRPDKIVEQVEEAGLKMLVRLDRQPFWSQDEPWPPLENAPPADLQDFGDFCGAVAERYRGRITAYQIWNEPNLSREWGEQPPNPVAYTELLEICYKAIKEADPNAIVVSAALAPTGTGLPLAMPDTEFLQGMYDAGAANYFDVLGLNAPGYKAPPETPPEEGESNPEYGGGRWFVFRHVEDMREVMEDNGDAGKQVAILELGWTTDQLNPDYTWHAVSEEEQADYLVRAYQFAEENWSPWIGLVVTIYLADYDWTPEANEQWWWSINLPDGTPRLAYSALRDMEK